MTKARTSKIDRQLNKLANSLTTEQVIKLHQIIQPIDADDPINQLSDDELLAELGA